VFRTDDETLGEKLVVLCPVPTTNCCQQCKFDFVSVEDFLCKCREIYAEIHRVDTGDSLIKRPIEDEKVPILLDIDDIV